MLLEASLRPVSETTAVMTLRGALTLGTSLKDAETQLCAAVERGVCRLVLEMSGVFYVDSAGLGMLVHAAGMAARRGGAVRLSGVTERVASGLRIARVEAVLPMDADTGTALAALGG